MVKVKVCGIKRLEDALMAIGLGADAVGLLVGQKHTSSDFIDKSLARKIVNKLPPFCSSVLVTHLEKPDEISKLASYIGVNTVQLHGDTSPKQAREIRDLLKGVKVYKAIHVVDDKSARQVLHYTKSVDAILLDSVNVSTGQVGGIGKTHDWNISRKIIKQCKIPVIMAGGIGPDNVRSVVEKLKPFGVDSNSGTKNDDRYKDPEKLRLYIERAKMFGLNS